MKIYFIGGTSCGKTTLARYFSEKYKLKLLPEFARIILAEQELQIDNLRANINVVNKYQTDIFYRQIEEEKKYTEFVSDRTALDALAYSAQYSTIFSKLIWTQELKDYVAKLKSDKAKIFFVRPSKATLKADGVRESLVWDGIIAVDANIKLLVEMFELSVIQISTDSMQERVRTIEAVLS